MVESLFCASQELNEQTIVSYGDIIFEKKVLDKLIQSKADFSVVVDKNWKRYWEMRFDNPLDDAESLKIDTDGDSLSDKNEIILFGSNPLNDTVDFDDDSFKNIRYG